MAMDIQTFKSKISDKAMYSKSSNVDTYHCNEGDAVDQCTKHFMNKIQCDLVFSAVVTVG